MALQWLKKDAAGLVTVVVQDRLTGLVRMVAYADEPAVQATLDTGEGHFYSRSRGKPWRKGESSGNTLKVSEVWADCDADCLIYLVEAAGPSCHTGRESCFFRVVGTDGEFVEDPQQHAAHTFPRLWTALLARRNATGDKSYTRHLLDKGAPKIGEKLREEAGELADAIADESDERVASEASDVIYHLLVGLLHRGVAWADVSRELARRFGMSGHDEKASRKSS